MRNFFNAVFERPDIGYFFRPEPAFALNSKILNRHRNRIGRNRSTVLIVCIGYGRSESRGKHRLSLDASSKTATYLKIRHLRHTSAVGSMSSGIRLDNVRTPVDKRQNTPDTPGEKCGAKERPPPARLSTQWPTAKNRRPRRPHRRPDAVSSFSIIIVVIIIITVALAAALFHHRTRRRVTFWRIHGDRGYPAVTDNNRTVAVSRLVFLLNGTDRTGRAKII